MNPYSLNRSNLKAETISMCVEFSTYIPAGYNFYHIFNYKFFSIIFLKTSR